MSHPKIVRRTRGPRTADPRTTRPPRTAGPRTTRPPRTAGPRTTRPPRTAGPRTTRPPRTAGPRTTRPPGQLVLGPHVLLGQLVLGPHVPLRTSCPPTFYHEAEIILHCAIICSCFTQRGTSVLLGACSRGRGERHAVLGPIVRPSLGKLVLGPRRCCPQNST